VKRRYLVLRPSGGPVSIPGMCDVLIMHGPTPEHVQTNLRSMGVMGARLVEVDENDRPVVTA
jgi:hypothetical protein